MYQSSGQSASCAKKGKIRNRVQIKTKSLLEMFFKVLLRVMRKFLFWVVTLRLNTKLTICSVISSLWYMGVWRSWAEFPDGVKSIAGFFFSSICLHILFWEILWKISKKSWQPAFSSHRKFHYWNTLSWYQIRTQTQSIFLVFSTQENMPNCFWKCQLFGVCLVKNGNHLWQKNSSFMTHNSIFPFDFPVQVWFPEKNTPDFTKGNSHLHLLILLDTNICA